MRQNFVVYEFINRLRKLLLQSVSIQYVLQAVFTLADKHADKKITLSCRFSFTVTDYMRNPFF